MSKIIKGISVLADMTVLLYSAMWSAAAVYMLFTEDYPWWLLMSLVAICIYAAGKAVQNLKEEL